MPRRTDLLNKRPAVAMRLLPTFATAMLLAGTLTTFCPLLSPGAHAASPAAVEAYKRGMFFLKRNEPNLAIKEFNRSIAIDPNNLDALIQRVLFFCSLDQAAKALDDCNKIISLDPSAKRYRDVYIYRAQSEKQREMPEEVIKDCDKALALGCENKELIYNIRIYGYRNTDRYKEALVDLTTLLEKYKIGNADRLYRSRSEIYEALNQPQKAVDDLQKALAINPKYDACYEQLARLHEHMGQPNKAIDDYTAALKVAPEDDSLILDRGQLKMRMGKYPEALIDINKVIEIDPNLTSKMYDNRADIYLKLGKADLAKKDRAKAEKIRDPLN